MILDSSVIVALIYKEPDWQVLLSVLETSDTIGVGAPTLSETGIVLAAQRGLTPYLHRFIQEFEVQVIPFGDHHWVEAVRAYTQYGRGRHPAQLNFGDCLAYATALLAQRPLLCKGNDFRKTDLPIVQY
jgi:ribonuclease VapC